MTTSPPTASFDHQLEDTDLLTEIAILYYQQSATQEEISKKFGISRPKVSRLLRKAREEGIVEITVKFHPIHSAQLEQRLMDRFNLKRALIALDQPSAQEQRMQVSTLVSAYLDGYLRDDVVVAVGQGQNVAAVADHPGIVSHRNARFVCAIGGTHRSGDTINADHICRRLAKKFGGTSETLYAPAYVDSEVTQQVFITHPNVSETLNQARKAEFALVGIGDMDENSHMVKLGCFTAKEFVEARLNDGIVGDIGGFDFFRLDGQQAGTLMRGRVVGLEMSDLHRIPNVIAMASESRKALAILGALRTGVIDVLATSASCAMALLNMSDS
ncbi:sugar-binding transcriptional regulator [Photobacterium sp. WH77]|uniref:Sugar-binding transcriptional regulator n=1 Tax=Photobacterium arenosum TaxID=2774143 RepID=A0ABR9BSK7_9GAMM|nr:MULTISPECIES: sugar-binding transcriptional regulator [Photobacterium]MBD8515299.1 sugar-binding transcriptional regulator [Photobacterium arenosum]MBV7264529.1 sugar-binding transcriptional regulator [Photobacterium sp. WH24]MCG2838041.1 sugar-binding transcriptional regulator [Photobacterium sp. WH77]MCG2845659.1 sugar-binding transcriptional regulator [Photobacterium sp. WH80]MDO6583878.1 sugar-binding transcriptional regulator [Photobacterium sp. 2_MG-2023]